MVALFELCRATHAWAGLGDLIMPGALIEGHAKYERDCRRCHQPFHKEAQGRLCLDCHKQIAGDIVSGQGFHSRVVTEEQPSCRSCHSDHEGRSADIAPLDPLTFDHAMTDFLLEGAHGRLACSDCHAATAKHRDTPTECRTCHHRSDPHDGAFAADCGECHGADGWRTARFDHGTTEFPLEGKHLEAACTQCHADASYRGTAKRCGACHVFDDVHRGAYQVDCVVCHRTASWETISFDHDNRTKFSLTGKHQSTPCKRCHADNPYRVRASSSCVDCHRADDRHRGRNGGDCSKCHDTRRWESAHFDHDQATKFPLRGKHADIACESCHRGAVSQQRLVSDCVGCHASVDAHAGQLGSDCAACHHESGWDDRVDYDHDLADFPLLGVHGATACEECHLTSVFSQAPRTCDACHATDDAHDGRLGRDCALCHNPNGWLLWRFDHDRQTAFPLEGSHRDLDCMACHVASLASHRWRVSACADCHRGDDVHEGRFGEHCERCHGSDSFDQVRMP